MCWPLACQRPEVEENVCMKNPSAAKRYCVHRKQVFCGNGLFFVFSSALATETEEKKGKQNGTHQI